MKVAFIARSTLHEVHGGITVQVIETAKHLRELGVNVTVHLANEKINYNAYDLFHFFDITRPANILYHISRLKKPFVLTPILIDYSEYDKQYRQGISGFIFRLVSPDTNEYIKAILRWLLKKDKLQSKNYIWKGHKKSIRYILENVSMILPNSKAEYDKLKKLYKIGKPYSVVYNGIDKKIFFSNPVIKEENLVVCAARIEGIKNQVNLIKALNDTNFKLVLIGQHTQNQKKYYRLCRRLASDNVEFTGKLSQEEVANYYKKAKVHVLPSWFETCGLSSLEAAAMGCNIVITDKGFTREYFGEDAFYCEPGNIESIYEAVNKASKSFPQKKLQEKVLREYTWEQTAIQTLEAYKKII